MRFEILMTVYLSAFHSLVLIFTRSPRSRRQRGLECLYCLHTITLMSLCLLTGASVCQYDKTLSFTNDKKLAMVEEVYTLENHHGLEFQDRD